MTKQSLWIRILIIILLQSALLLIMIANRQAILSSDTIVVLQTRPIDPRSLFRGDYVRLKYEINELNLDTLSGDKTFKRNDSVYVILKKQDLYWQAQAVFRNRPEAQTSQQVFIQGVVKSVKNKKWDVNLKAYTQITRIDVSYGIENYFVPEGEGLKLERPKPADIVTLEIALDDKGHAAIKHLLLNDVRQYEEALF